MSRSRSIRFAAVLCAVTLAASACARDEEVPERPTDEVVLGYILPESGRLAFLGGPMIGGVRMAVQEMQDAGGPLGLPIRLLTGDEADDETLAAQAADRLIGEGVQAIIGAAASGMSLAIIERVTRARVVQCSPSNTGPAFTDYEDDGYYFRTAPSDVLQGPVLADIILEDNRERVALLARADEYGQGLLNATKDALVEGGAQVVLDDTYDPNATTFDAEVGRVTASNPDAVVLITFEEGKDIIRALIETGVSPDQMYGADGLRSSTLNEDIDPANPNAVDGFKGTAPDPGAVPGFLERFAEFAPDVDETIYAPQAYDCTMLIGLAIVAADSPEPRDFVGEIIPLTRGDNACSGFRECADLLADGQTIRYQFVSGVDEFTDEGEPVNGDYEVWQWVDAELQSLESREATLPE